MEVILLQKVRNLGDLGDTVKVRPGYGRNFLIPRGVVLPATANNVKVFESRRAELQAASAERIDQANARADKLRGREFVIAMRASDEGKLFGSVGPQEIADKINEEDVALDAKEVVLPDGQIRLVGEHTALLQLHPEVEAEITVIVAQLTDMGINMPPRRADDTPEDATADEVEGERVEDAGEPADQSVEESAEETRIDADTGEVQEEDEAR